MVRIGSGKKGRLKMIEIGTKYAVGADRHNIILYVKKGKDKQGKDRWKADSFYGNLQNALKGLVELGVRETKLTDIDAVIAKQDELYVLINKALDGGLAAEVHL